VAADQVLPVVGQVLAVLLAVFPAAEVEVVELQVDGELVRGGLDHAHAFGHDLLADAVAGDDGDALHARPPWQRYLVCRYSSRPQCEPSRP
jgi:hypothetical protein